MNDIGKNKKAKFKRFPLNNDDERKILSAILATTNMGCNVEIHKCKIRDIVQEMLWISGSPAFPVHSLTFNAVRLEWLGLVGSETTLREGEVEKAFDAESKEFYKDLKTGCPDYWKDAYNIIVSYRESIARCQQKAV